MRRSRYETREESRETIIRGRYRERHVPKSLRSMPRNKQQQPMPTQQKYPYRQGIFQQQRDERSTSSTEKSSLYNTDHSSRTQQTDVRANLSKPSLFHIAESSGATLAAAAISPFDEDRRGLREHPRFFEEAGDDLRESPSDELPLDLVEKAIDKVVDATCGNIAATSGTQAASLLTKSYLKSEDLLLGDDGIVDPIIPNPFEGLRSDTRPVYEAASFPKVTFREVKLDAKKTVASTAMQYPEPRRPRIRPKIQEPPSTARTKSKSPIRSMVNRVKSVQNMLARRRKHPIKESKTKKAELLEGIGASNVNRYSRVRAHSDTSETSKGRAKSRRGRTLESHGSGEDSTSSFTLALHECPSVREYPARTNRARHNRSIRQPLHSDESYTSDPSLPPRLPLHKYRLRDEKPSEESSGAHHRRNGSFPSADECSSGLESSVDPYSSIEKSASSTSSLSNDLIPQVEDYILPSEGPPAHPDVIEEVSTEVQRVPIIRERQIQSDPTSKIGKFGTALDPPAAMIGTSVPASRKTIKRRRTVSQPNPLSHYERMAKLFVPVLYRILCKCQRKSLQFHREPELAIVPRWSAPQEYMLSELVHVAMYLMQQPNREGLKKLSKEFKRKRRRRRRKRSSVLDELCDQLSLLDQKLLEITNETTVNNSVLNEDEDPLVEDEGPPFIEEIDDWSDDEIPPDFDGMFDGTSSPELFDINVDVEGSQADTKHQEIFGGLKTNDPEFNDLIEMAYVVTDLSRDQFIDAHQNDSLKDNEDDDLEQELTNLSFVEEIIQTELSQVDSGEGTYKDESVCEEILQGQLSGAASGEETCPEESFTEETVTTEISKTDLDHRGRRDDSMDIIETEISPLGSEEEKFQEGHARAECYDAELSDDSQVEEIFVEEPVSEKEIVVEVSKSGSVNWGEECVEEEMTTGSVMCNDRPAKTCHQEASETDEKNQLGLKSQKKNDISQPVVKPSTISLPKKRPVKTLKDSPWDDDMFPDDELQEDAEMFPDDETDAIDQPEDEIHEYDETGNTSVAITETSRSEENREKVQSSSEERREKVQSSSEDAESSFCDLQSVPSDEVFTAKSKCSDTDLRHGRAGGKERSSFQNRTMATSIDAKDRKFGSKVSVLSRFKNQNYGRKETLSPGAAYIQRTNQAETLSIDKAYIPRRKEVVPLQLPVISPSSKTEDDVTVESTPSDEASADIKENGSDDGREVANIGESEKPEESFRDGLKTSVVEESIDEKNPAVEIIVAPSAPELDSKEEEQPLFTTLSCETEESDPICAAVNRKLAEVRQSIIPDPDDEMIMETIGMSMSMNSVSKTPRSTASSAIPDPEDSMIIESLSPRSDSMKLKISGTTGLDDSREQLSRKSVEAVKTGAGSPVVMETVYLAESEMVTEKLFTVLEEGTTSSSCNASIQGSTRNETNRERKGLKSSTSGKVRQAIMKFNGGGSTSCKSPKETDVVVDANSVVQNTQSPDQKQKSSIGSNKIQTSLQPPKTTKGNAAALIARFEAKVGPVNAESTYPAVLEEEQPIEATIADTSSVPVAPGKHLSDEHPHDANVADTFPIPVASASSDEQPFDAYDSTSFAPATPTKSSSDVNGRRDKDAAAEHPKSSPVNGPSALIAELKMRLNSPSGKHRHEAFYDKIPNLLSESSGSHLEAPKRRRSKECSSPSKKETTLHQMTSGEASTSPSKRKSKESSKVNQLRSQFETKISMKKSLSKDQEGQVENAKIQSQTSSGKKQLPLHGFVKAGSKKVGSNPECLIDKVKPPVHKPSKNFSPGPIDFEALNESLLQIRNEEMMEQRNEVYGQENEKDFQADEEESSKLPITELQLKEVSSSVSELEGPRVKMFSRGMCHCLPAGRENSDDSNSIEQLKKIGRRQSVQSPTPKVEPNNDELVPAVFSMDAVLDDNMQRTADAAVKALELVLTQGAANAAAAISQNDSQVSCFHECITPVTEGSFNAFSQAIVRKSTKKMMIPQSDEETLTLEDNNSKGQQAAEKDVQAKPNRMGTDQALHQKEPSKGPLALGNINENDDNDDWAQIAIEQNNVDDLIEALRSQSSDVDPFMNVISDQGHLSRIDATVSPMSSDWAGSISRLGAQPLSSTQRDEWSKRNLLSGTTTLSSEGDSDYNLQQYRQQRSPGAETFDERKLDIDFHYESPAGSIRGPYDDMLKEQKRRGGRPPRAKRSQKRRSRDPPTGRFYQDEDGASTTVSTTASTGRRDPGDSFDKDYQLYSYSDRHGSSPKRQDENRPDYYDFPAPPSQQYDSDVSALTMSQGSMTRSMKSQDPEQALRSFQEMENRKASSSEWLYSGKRETATTVPSSPSARTNSNRTKGTIAVVVAGNDRRSSSSSMWCSESFGTMIQDCFATAPPGQQDTKSIQDAPTTPSSPYPLPSPKRKFRGPPPIDAPSPGPQELIGSITTNDNRTYF